MANGLTVSRALLAIPFVISLAIGNQSLSWMIFCLCGITDFIDGFLAKKAGGGTDFGSRLDPLADKIIIVAALLWMTSQYILPFWAIWIIISRELIVTGWRSTAMKGGIASYGGKLKTILQFTSIMLLLFPTHWSTFSVLEVLYQLGYVLFWISLIIAISSGFLYFKRQTAVHLK